MDQFLACRSGEGMGSSCHFVTMERSNSSVWTDQDLYLLQENMREGTLPVKGRERTLIPGRESLGLGPGAEHESSRSAPVFREAFPDFSMFPQRLASFETWAELVPSSAIVGQRTSRSLSHPGSCPAISLWQQQGTRTTVGKGSARKFPSAMPSHLLCVDPDTFTW